MARLCGASVKKAPVLDKRIELQAVTRTSDGAGGFDDNWSTQFASWANIMPANANEKYRAAQMETYITHRIVMRYREGVTTARRIKYGQRFFNIVAVLNVNEGNSYLEIKAVEGAAT